MYEVYKCPKCKRVLCSEGGSWDHKCIPKEFAVWGEPQPTESTKSESVLDHVLSDLKSRGEMGKKKYGTDLKTFNGRDPLKDAYEEALDLAMYLKQELLEREKNKNQNAF